MAVTIDTYYSEKIIDGARPSVPDVPSNEIPPVLNPPGSGNLPPTPPVAKTYASEAAMIADQLNQSTGYLYFDGTANWWYNGGITGTIADYQAFSSGSGSAPVAAFYASQAAMIAAQGAQVANYFYFDSVRYWEYLGTTAGTIADYRKVVQGLSPYELAQEGASDGDVLTWVAANSRYEPVAPSGGGGSNWTVGSGFIYRNGAVSIGQTAISANTTFEVKSLTSTAGDTIFRTLRNSGATALGILENGSVNIPATNIALGGATFSSLGDGLRYRASVTGVSIDVFLIEDSSGASMFRVLGDKTVTMFGSRVLIGNPSTYTSVGLTLKGADNSNGTFALEVQNSSATQIMLLRSSGIFLLPTARHAFGTTSANVVNGCYFKGSSTSLSIFEIANSSDSVKFRVYGNGNMEIGDAGNIVLATTTGTKIGTATTQKLSFWNKTPIIQPTTGITGATRVGGGGTTVTDTDTFGGYTLQKIAAALINVGILA